MAKEAAKYHLKMVIQYPLYGGAGSYSHNHDSEDYGGLNDAKSKTAEVALLATDGFYSIPNFLENGNMKTCDSVGDSDAVLGWQTAEEVAILLAKVAAYKNENTL